MQFLTLSRRRSDAFPPDAFTPELIAAEAQRASGSCTSQACFARFGNAATPPALRLSWEAPGEAEVRQAVASLPIFKAGMLELTCLVPLAPYAGFGPAQ